MLYENMTQQDIIKLLGYSQPWKGNFKRIIERQAKFGKIITETGKDKQTNKKLYSINLPDELYSIPPGFTLIKDNLTLAEAGEYLHYTYESMKSAWDTLIKRQLENFDRAVIKYYDLLNQTKIAIAEKPSPKNQDLQNEEWKTLIENKEYEISNYGRLRKKITKEIIKGYENNQGYIVATKQQYLIHRLVKNTFDPREDSKELFVDHINGKRNDNRLKNLRWVSPTKNSYYRDENLTNIGELLATQIKKYGYDTIFNTLKQLDN